MKFEDLEDELGDLLNFTSGGTDQDFSATQLKKALNRAYTREVRTAKLEGFQEWFKAVEEVTWTANSVTYTLPTSLRMRDIIEIQDITSYDPGYEITIHQGSTGGIFWKDRKTLQWGQDGPPEDKTLRFFYFLQPVEMVNPDDEPDVIPSDFHEMLYWSAACELRKRADEKAPFSWEKELGDIRLDYYKTLSRGRPVSQPPSVRFGNGISVSSPAATQDGSSIGN